jgi:hypothetical protein
VQKELGTGLEVPTVATERKLLICDLYFARAHYQDICVRKEAGHFDSHVTVPKVCGNKMAKYPV